MTAQSSPDEVPVLGRDTPNENERRAIGGFVIEGPYSREDIDLLQVEVPVGCQRVADAFQDEIKTDRSLSEVLSKRTHSEMPKGFPDEKDLSTQFGSRMASYTAKIDAVVVTTDEILIVEVKTRNQRIEGMHDAYEGFGQVLMNRDRFEEDYPSVARSRPIKGVLLAEDAQVDDELLEDSFTSRRVSFFDPVQGGFLFRC